MRPRRFRISGITVAAATHTGNILSIKVDIAES